MKLLNLGGWSAVFKPIVLSGMNSVDGSLGI